APDVATAAARRLRPQGWGIADEPCPVAAWPPATYSLVLGTDDRVVSARWARDAAREVLEVEPVELPGGHAPMLARPAELADALVALADHRRTPASTDPSSSSTAPSAPASRRRRSAG